MKFNIKKVVIVTLLLILFYSFSSFLPVYADSPKKGLNFDSADKFIENGKKQQGIKDLDEIGENFSEIGKVIVFIGAGVLVAGLGYIGIMYMVSSPEKRAKLKQQLIGVLVAGVVIFGAYSIWSVLIQILAGTIDG